MGFPQTPISLFHLDGWMAESIVTALTCDVMQAAARRNNQIAAAFISFNLFYLLNKSCVGSAVWETDQMIPANWKE